MTHERLHGYAPGTYTCRCLECGSEFEGDKRAVQCLLCAEKEERETCQHCHGTGQPGGILGGPEQGICAYCRGSGRVE
jgi:hypothetical protein